MAEPKENNDGFQDIGDGEIADPLSSKVQVPPQKEETDVVLEKQKSKADPTMDEKLKSVFGNDVLFEDRVPKNVQVYRPKGSRVNLDASPGKEDGESKSNQSIDGNNLSPIRSPVRTMDMDTKNPNQIAGMMQIKAEKSPDGEEPEAGEKKVKMRYKDIVANSDVFEEDRIEATFIGNHVTCSGTLKLGQFMVVVT